MISASFVVPIHAADGGVEFPDWYSTSNSIMYFPGTAPRYYKVQSNGLFAASDLNSFATFAAGQWAELINLQQVVDVGSEGEEDGEVIEPYYDILITDVSRANVDENAPTGAIGYTVTSETAERAATNPQGTCIVYRLNWSAVYLIYDSETANYPFNKLRCAATHELGHAIGYKGHDDHVDTLMYYSDENYDVYGIYTPQTRDITHLHNVYPYLINSLQEVQ